MSIRRYFSLTEISAYCYTILSGYSPTLVTFTCTATADGLQGVAWPFIRCFRVQISRSSGPHCNVITYALVPIDNNILQRSAKLSANVLCNRYSHCVEPTLYSAIRESCFFTRLYGISLDLHTCDRLAQLSRRSVSRICFSCIDN